VTTIRPVVRRFRLPTGAVLIAIEALAFLLVLAWAFLLALFISVGGHQNPYAPAISMLCLVGLPGTWLVFIGAAHRSFRRGTSTRLLGVLLLAPIGVTVAMVLIISVWMFLYPDYPQCMTKEISDQPPFCRDFSSEN
jgi:hypothetical protein